jgi:hypothetical protein
MQKIDRQVAFTGTKDVAEPLRFDPARLEAYLAREVPGFAGPLQCSSSRAGSPTRPICWKLRRGNTCCGGSRRASCCRRRTRSTANSASSRR